MWGKPGNCGWWSWTSKGCHIHVLTSPGIQPAERMPEFSPSAPPSDPDNPAKSLKPLGSTGSGSAGGLADFVAGAIGGVAICAINQPFDTIKVIMQSQPERFQSSYHALKAVLSQSPLALFRGMSVPMATVPLIHAVMFSGYGSAKRYLAESAAHDKPWFPPDDSRRPSHAAGSPHGILTVADKGVLTLDDEIDESDLDLWQITTAGGWSGFVNSFIVGPVELVKVQLQVQAADMKTGHSMRIAGLESRVFTGPVDFAVEAVKRHGWRAAFQGMVPTTVVETLACASQFYSYEGLLRWMISSQQGITSGRVDTDDATVTQQLFAGGFSGIVANGCIYPLDVLKTRIQSFPVGVAVPVWGARHPWIPDGGMWNVSKFVWKTEGWRGFWKGVWPCLLPAFPANAVGFVIYESVVKYWPK